MEGTRPRWIKPTVILIPALTWALLGIIMTRPAPLQKVVESKDQTLISAVETYLREQGISYEREGQGAILVDSKQSGKIAVMLKDHLHDLSLTTNGVSEVQ